MLAEFAPGDLNCEDSKFIATDGLGRGCHLFTFGLGAEGAQSASLAHASVVIQPDKRQYFSSWVMIHKWAKDEWPAIDAS